MAFVHAYKRTKTYVWGPLTFEPNEAGDVVCDVQDHSIVAKLLQTPTGFRLYGPQSAEAEISTVLTQFAEPDPTDEVVTLPPEPGPDAPEPSADSLYVLRSGDDVLDLRELDDGQLHAFAKANKITVPHKAKGDKVRDAIVAALRVPE